MKKIVLFFSFLFMAVFGVSANGEGNSPPVRMQLFTESQDQMVVQLTQESVVPIMMRAEVVTPRCRDVQFSYSSPILSAISKMRGSEIEFSAAVMNSKKSTVDGMLELRTEVLPRCRTVLFTVSQKSGFHSDFFV